MERFLPILIPLAVVVVFPIFWMAIVVPISRVLGWSALAKHFAVPADKNVFGQSFGWSSVQFNNFGGYSSCIGTVVSKQGIYLRPIRLFRIGHEPLLIPWRAIDDVAS